MLVMVSFTQLSILSYVRNVVAHTDNAPASPCPDPFNRLFCGESAPLIFFLLSFVVEFELTTILTFKNADETCHQLVDVDGQQQPWGQLGSV